MYAASPASPRNGLAGAITGYPSCRSRSITPFQLEESAKAPCTSTTVGFGWDGPCSALAALAEPVAAVRVSAATPATAPSTATRLRVGRIAVLTFMVTSPSGRGS